MSKKNYHLLPGHSDLENPGTWRKYKNGLCDTCQSGCCTMVLEVSAKDLIRLELTDEWEVENCLRDLVKRLKNEKLIKRYNFKSGVFVLGQTREGDCLFLDEERQCTMYENRPNVCRSHPEKLSDRIGYCPYCPL